MAKTFENLLRKIYESLQETDTNEFPRIKFFLQTIIIKNMYPAGYYKPPHYDKETEEKIINVITKTPKFLILDTRKFSNFRKIKQILRTVLHPLYDYKGVVLIIEVLAPRKIEHTKDVFKHIYEKYTFKQQIIRKKEDAYIFAPYEVNINGKTYIIERNLSFSFDNVINIYNPFNTFFKKYIVVEKTHNNNRMFLALTIGIINKETLDKHYKDNNYENK